MKNGLSTSDSPFFVPARTQVRVRCFAQMLRVA